MALPLTPVWKVPELASLGVPELPPPPQHAVMPFEGGETAGDYQGCRTHEHPPQLFRVLRIDAGRGSPHSCVHSAQLRGQRTLVFRWMFRCMTACACLQGCNACRAGSTTAAASRPNPLLTLTHPKGEPLTATVVQNATRALHVP